IKDRKCDELEMKAVEERERIDNMTQHLKNVQKEIKNSEALLDFKRKELESKEHLLSLDQRQIGRIEADILRNRKIIQERKNMLNEARNAIENANAKLDKLRTELEWGQEELEQWSLAAQQKEEDEVQLEEYRRSDDIKVGDGKMLDILSDHRVYTYCLSLIKVKGLRKQLEEILEKIYDSTQVLNERATETEALQIEMNKVSEQLEQATEARAADLAAWEAGVDVNKRKDEELVALGEQHVEESKRLKEKELRLAELRKIDENFDKSIKEKEAVVSLTDRELGLLRLENLKVREEVEKLRDEVEVIRAEVSAATSEQNQKRNEIEQWEKRVEEQKAKVTVLNKKLAGEKKRQEEVVNSKMNKEQLAREAEGILNKAITRAGELELQLKQAKEELFKTTQELYRERETETTRLGEISGIQSAIKNVKARISKVEAERQRQQELLYNVDFECQLMQRKVARISGERSSEEKAELNSKIENYEAQLKEQQRLLQLLKTQLKLQDTELLQAKKRLSKARAVEKACEDKIKELEREIDMSTREDSQKKRERDEAAAMRESLKLEVERLKAPLLELVERVVEAENRKMEMQLEFKEREHELHIISEELRSELRLVNEQKQALQMQLGERKEVIYNIKARFDGLVNRRKSMMADSEGGEEKSQAYFVLKAAQIKDSLQREGDEIDRKIRIAEQELRGLENSLGYLINSNQSYKAGLKGSSERERARDEKVMGEGDALEKQLRHASEVLHKKKKRMAELTAIADADEARKLQMIEDSRQLRAKISRLLETKNRLSRDVAEGSGKVTRALRSLEAMKERVAAGIESGNLREEVEEANGRLMRGKEQQEHLLATLKSLVQAVIDNHHPNTEHDLCGVSGALPHVPIIWTIVEFKLRRVDIFSIHLSRYPG
ncbi:hypothetical protein FOL47_010845, partial [Perkinsus chesapeaki]